MSSSTTTTPPSSAGESSPAAEAVARQSQTTSRKITLQSSDKESFEVEEAVACQSQTIKHMIEDGFADDGIPLHNVTGSILAKVIEYCKKHVEAASLPASDVDDESESELKAWDAEFVNVDRVTLIDLILAANYLNIKGLLDLTLDKVVDLIRGKQPEEIREILGIENDFSPEAEAEIRTENQWAFRR